MSKIHFAAAAVAAQHNISACLDKSSWYLSGIRFEPFEMKNDEEVWSYENTAVFDVSCFQYVVLAVMFSQGSPYKKPIYTNFAFLINVIILIGVAVWLTIYPTGKL